MVIKGIRSDEIQGREEFSRLGPGTFQLSEHQEATARQKGGNPGMSLPESHMQSFLKEVMMSCAQYVDGPSEAETEN